MPQTKKDWNKAVRLMPYTLQQTKRLSSSLTSSTHSNKKSIGSIAKLLSLWIKHPKPLNQPQKLDKSSQRLKRDKFLDSLFAFCRMQSRWSRLQPALRVCWSKDSGIKTRTTSRTCCRVRQTETRSSSLLISSWEADWLRLLSTIKSSDITTFWFDGFKNTAGRIQTQMPNQK